MRSLPTVIFVVYYAYRLSRNAGVRLRITGPGVIGPHAAADRSLRGFRLEVRPEPAICVVVSARGYPGSHPSGEPIEIPRLLPPGVTVLHAGTARGPEGRLVSAGGRVLGVTAVGPTLGEAASRAYEACAAIRYDSKYYRRDIGARQLNRQ